MIVGSLLLILVAVGLLVAGVLSGSNALIIACIVATAVAAVVLILGVRQSANGEDEESEYEGREPGGPEGQPGYRGAPGQRDAQHGSRPQADRPGAVPGGSSRSGPDRAGEAVDGAAERGSTITEEAPSSTIPSQGGAGEFEAAEAEDHEARSTDAESGAPIDEDPPDEPSAQVTSPSNAARIAAMTTEVLVIDGRPRYHVSGCVHLLGRDSEPLPVGEALELGFSPCGMCEADSVLLESADS